MAHLVVRIGHVACGLLVVNRNRLDAVGGARRRVEKTDVPVTAYAEQVWNFFLDQVLNHDLGALVRFALGRFARRGVLVRCRWGDYLIRCIHD